ncbi:hypothetical protein JCM12214_21920 [Geobacillus vulcani]
MHEFQKFVDKTLFIDHNFLPPAYVFHLKYTEMFRQEPNRTPERSARTALTATFAMRQRELPGSTDEKIRKQWET